MERIKVMKLACIILLMYVFSNCGNKELPNPFDPNTSKPTTPTARPSSLGISGDTADVKTVSRAGLVIMGGGTDVDAAFRWMIERSGGGDVVIIRASGTNAYNDYVNRLGKVNSVETLKIDSRKLADDDRVANIIRNAEMLFIAGGDQADYLGYWKDTKVMRAVNYLLTEKQVPVGGTSAGAAILGNYYFGALRGSVDSEEALTNPYNTKITIGKDDFLKAPYMNNIITDQHFSQRNREGRLIVFLSRILKDWGKAANAIAVDERTAVCIDDTGMAEVLGLNKACFVKTDISKLPENINDGIPLTWNHAGKAVQVYSVLGTIANNKFNMNTFQPQNATSFESYLWSVVSGSWKVVQ